jgi:hypothetical protein
VFDEEALARQKAEDASEGEQPAEKS